MTEVDVPNLTEVDGVPVYWADGPPPLRACLAFRVGRADEPLPRTGISHITEHLALWRLRDSAYGYNGATTLGRTFFFATGSGEEMANFMAQVSENIAALPLDRFEVERKVLMNEAQSRGGSVFNTHMNLRFGAEGFGNGLYREFALLAARDSEIQDWATSRFTAQNATAWVSGPLPHGLRFPLPQGGRRRQADPVAMDGVQYPCVAAIWGQGAGVSMTASRSVAAGMVMHVAQRRATEKLRYQDGMVYAVNSTYEPISPGVALLGVWCEVPDSEAMQVAIAIHEILGVLASEGPTAEELSRCVEETRRGMESPEAILASLNRAILDELDEQEFWTPRRTREEMLAVTPAIAAQAMAESMETALYVAPGTPHGSLGNLASYPMFSRNRVAGRRYRNRYANHFRPPPILTSAPDGLTFTPTPGQDATVLFSDVAVCLRHPKGRHLIARDAFRVLVNADEWYSGPKVLALVDERVPEELMVDLDESQPMPTSMRLPPGAKPALGVELSDRSLNIVIAVVLLALFVLAVVETGGRADGRSTILGIVIFVILPIGGGRALYLAIRHRRQKR